MICDVHAHYTPRNFSEFMGDRFASPVHLPVKRGMALHPFSDSPEDIEGRFAMMEEAGVGRQVLSPNHPPYLPDEAECVTAVKMLNDAYAEFAHRFPDRISSYVMLPLPHIDASLQGDGARLRRAGLRRGQHEHRLPRTLGRRDRVRADLRRDEPARRRACSCIRPGAGICSPFIIDYKFRGIGRHLARGRDLRPAHDREADPVPLSEDQVHRAASRRPDPDAAQPARQTGAEPARPSRTSPRRRASPRRNSITTRCATARNRRFCAPSKPSAPTISSPAATIRCCRITKPTSETFAYIERLGLPKSDTDKILHHNAQALFGFEH